MGIDQSRCKSLQRPLNIALIGYGKMGKAVEAAAKARSHTITAIIDPHLATSKISEDTLADTDICIDFSHPNTVVENIKKIAAAHKNIVVGTTGWDSHREEVKHIVEEHQIGLLYAANFSIGVNLFYQIAAHAAQLIDRFDEYDAAIHEVHHKQKVDAPSGTGLTLGHLLIEHMQSKSNLVYGTQNYTNKPEEILLSSQRCGFNPGCHSISFDSPEDTITLTHQARNRDGFAKGAVRGAEWLWNKKGMYTMEDILTSYNEEILHG